MPAPLDVTPDDLRRLDATHAVDLFRKLLLAEAHTMGITTSEVEVPLNIYVSDGGIDAEVQGAASRSGQGLIVVPGPNFYQVKTGDFAIQRVSKIKEILFDTRVDDEDGNRTPREVLKQRVKHCLDLGGVLHVVLFGWDLPNNRDPEIVTKFREQLSDNGYTYPEARIEICRASKIIGYLARFPSLQMEAKQLRGGTLRTWVAWAADEDMGYAFHADDARDKVINGISGALRNGGLDATHIRILGDAGVGKTRLALEASRAEDIAPLTLYASGPEALETSDLFADILKTDNQAEAVLVVDECDGDSSRRLWNQLKGKGRRIKLVTVDNTPEDVGCEVRLVDLSDLARDQIKAILEDYGIPPDERERWAALCGGSPRVAHVIGINLRDFPDDDNLLREPSTMVVWKRFVAGADDPDGPVVRRREMVLRYLALFEYVGYKCEFRPEAAWVAAQVQQHDTNVTETAFHEVVSTLRRHKVLQGSSTLHINPKALHLKLWADWWEHYGAAFDFETFANGIPRSLLEGFYRQFKFAAVSEAARGIVRRLLGPGGYFEHDERLETELGGKFFLALAEADPASALDCLERTVGRWDRQRLEGATGSRRSFVWALEKIAIWKDLFRGAAQLLLALGEAENETWSNNASGAFASLFSLGVGPVAPTQASPAERFPVLEAALASPSPERRQLGLRGLDAALELNGVRHLGPEQQGLRPVPQLWSPESQQDLIDAHLKAWAMLDEALQRFEGEEEARALEIALRQGRSMVFHPLLNEPALSTVERLADDPDRATWASLVSFADGLRFHQDHLTPSAARRLEALRARLEGESFGSRLRRWVAVRSFDDEIELLGQETGRMRRALARLAGETLEDQSRLEPDLDWLNSVEAANGMQFGLELGRLDTDFALWTTLRAALVARRDAGNPFFLAGYLKALRERDAERWASELDAIIDDPTLRRYAIELAWRTGMTDGHLRHLVESAKRGEIAAEQFGLLTYSSELKQTAGDAFLPLANYLLELGGTYVFLVLRLWHAYFVHQSPDTARAMPKETALSLLTTALATKLDADQPMHDFRWNAVARTFVKQHEDTAVALGKAMLLHFGQDGTILGLYCAQSLETLNKIAREHPVEIWRAASAALLERGTRCFRIARWLRGEFGGVGSSAPSMITFVPPDLLWAWADEDLEGRAWYLATLVPPSLGQDGEFSLARELLVRYGDRDDVRRNLSSNFLTEGWMGEMSEHYSVKRLGFLQVLARETNSNVRCWVRDFVAHLKQSIDWSKAREERGQ
jgi:hypothetical protein